MAVPVNDGAPDRELQSSGGSFSSAESDAPDHEELESHLAQLEVAARAAAPGGEADAKLLDAVAVVRLQMQRFRLEQTGLQVRFLHSFRGILRV